ncbi:MAG: PmoA family protein [Isosphaeraceae bacterium]
MKPGIGAIILAAILGGSIPAHAAGWGLAIKNNGDALGETPLVTKVPPSVKPGVYRLVPRGGGETAVFAQVSQEEGESILTVMLPAVPARSTVHYTLDTRPGTERGDRWVSVKPSGTDIEVTISGKPFTVYRGGEASKPYLYPVIGPTGAAFTRAYPMVKDLPGEDHDHPHQRSFWFTHGKVNGLDFWASDPLNGNKPAFGSIRETSRRTGSGLSVGFIRTTNDWLDHDGKRVCSDERLMRFYSTKEARVLDFEITIRATDGPVTFGDTKEGMFGLRVASSMDVTKKKGGKITNAEGLTNEAAWGKASPWVDYTGPVDGKTVGIAILNHPSSFRFPTTWHVRTYGLFAANPFGWNDFGLKKSGDHTIPKGETMHFGYRVIFHEGDTEAARVADQFRTYSQPLPVEFQGE